MQLQRLWWVLLGKVQGSEVHRFLQLSIRAFLHAHFKDSAPGKAHAHCMGVLIKRKQEVQMLTSSCAVSACEPEPVQGMIALRRTRRPTDVDSGFIQHVPVSARARLGR